MDTKCSSYRASGLRRLNPCEPDSLEPLIMINTSGVALFIEAVHYTVTAVDFTTTARGIELGAMNLAQTTVTYRDN